MELEQHIINLQKFFTILVENGWQKKIYNGKIKVIEYFEVEEKTIIMCSDAANEYHFYKIDFTQLSKFLEMSEYVIRQNYLPIIDRIEPHNDKTSIERWKKRMGINIEVWWLYL